jgi:hypothetical protein
LSLGLVGSLGFGYSSILDVLMATFAHTEPVSFPCEVNAVIELICPIFALFSFFLELFAVG